MRGWALAIAVAGCARGSAGQHAGDARGSGANGDAPISISDSSMVTPDGNGCPVQPCTLSPQCGCSASMACDINAMTQMGTACRQVTAPGKETSTCSSGTDCAAGYVCVGDSFNAACEKYCAHDTDCASPRGRCVIQLDNSSSQPITGAVVCSSGCDPTQATPTACPSGWACDLFNATYMATSYDIVDCRKAGTATQGQTCSTTVACAAGFTCVTSGTSMTCAQICPQPQGTGCPTGKTCTSFSTAFVVGGQEYGACN